MKKPIKINQPAPKKEPEKKKENPTIATNHEARRDYFILESMEVGLVLKGCEVKSLREGKSSLAGSFARFDGPELYLYNFYIPPYNKGHHDNPDDPNQRRKLLMHRHQLTKLMQRVGEKGLLLVPLKAYFSDRGIAKIELALGKGKKHYDKRDDIKKDTIRREIDRSIKSRNQRNS